MSTGKCDWPQVGRVCLWGVCGKVLATDAAGEELGDFKPACHAAGGRFRVVTLKRGAVPNEA